MLTVIHLLKSNKGNEKKFNFCRAYRQMAHIAQAWFRRER